jgi:hypothetical protein
MPSAALVRSVEAVMRGTLLSADESEFGASARL